MPDVGIEHLLSPWTLCWHCNV